MRSLIPGALILAVLLTGCEAITPFSAKNQRIDEKLVVMSSDAGIKNAIVVQHTLWPYHFDPQAQTLNELGRRDLSVLAGYYREHPGTLSVRQGDTSAQLYESRVKTVLHAMETMGIDRSRVIIRDSLPGGDGMNSGHVLTILKKVEEGMTPGGGPGAGIQTMNQPVESNGY